MTALHDLVVRRILAAGLRLASAERLAGAEVGALCQEARSELDAALREVVRFEFDADVDADGAEERWSAGLLAGRNVGREADLASVSAGGAHGSGAGDAVVDRAGSAVRSTLPDRSRLWEDLIACEHDDQRVLDVAVRAVVQALGGEAVGARVSDRGELVPLAFHSSDPADLARMRALFETSQFRLGEGLAGEVAATGEPLFVPSVPPDVTRAVAAEPARPYLDEQRVTSMMIVPLRRGGQVIGTLGATRSGSSEGYTRSDLRVLEQIAELAALVMATT